MGVFIDLYTVDNYVDKHRHERDKFILAAEKFITKFFFAFSTNLVPLHVKRRTISRAEKKTMHEEL